MLNKLLTKKESQPLSQVDVELQKLAGELLGQIDFSLLDKNFIEEEWKKDKIKKIAAKVEIKNGVPFFDAPYGHHHGRYPDLRYTMIEACRRNSIQDCKFIVFLNDAYASSFPAFSIIRRLKEDVYNIPIPMGNSRGKREGCGTPILGWDEYINAHMSNSDSLYPWKEKSDVAVFRGQYAYQTYKLGEYTKTRAKSWVDVNRGHLYDLCKERKDLFDVGFNKVGQNNTEEEIPVIEAIPFFDQQRYKYIISVGTNANWAERIRLHMFTNSVLLKHEAECMEWFYYLMKPWEHYIPFNLMMTDLEEKVEWAKQNDEKCQNIVKSANEFSQKYLNEKTMIDFTAIAIKQYSYMYNDIGTREASLAE